MGSLPQTGCWQEALRLDLQLKIGFAALSVGEKRNYLRQSVKLLILCDLIDKIWHQIE